MFCRLERCSSGRNFFEAIQITVNVTGPYIIRSQSSFDTYGYFYNNSFDQAWPMNNLLGQDDESASSYQFLFSFTLNALHRYVVVVTTFYEGSTGRFLILSRGPGSTTLIRLNTSLFVDSKYKKHPQILFLLKNDFQYDKNG